MFATNFIAIYSKVVETCQTHGDAKGKVCGAMRHVEIVTLTKTTGTMTMDDQSGYH